MTQYATPMATNGVTRIATSTTRATVRHRAEKSATLPLSSIALRRAAVIEARGLYSVAALRRLSNDLFKRGQRCRVPPLRDGPNRGNLFAALRRKRRRLQKW
jgi:hypothetical protein